MTKLTKIKVFDCFKIMNFPAAPDGGIAASLGQATGYPSEDFNRPKGRGIKPPSAVGGLNTRRNFIIKVNKYNAALFRRNRLSTAKSQFLSAGS